MISPEIFRFHAEIKKRKKIFNYISITSCKLVEMNEKEMQHAVDKHMNWFSYMCCGLFSHSILILI
jgi:hypothetical protein